VPRTLRLALTCLLALAVGGSAAAAAAAAATTDTRVIAPNVVAGGVAIGGMTVDQATARLQSQLAAPLARWILVGAAGHVYKLEPAQAQLHFDPRLTAERAYEAGAATPQGTATPVQVPLAVDFSQQFVHDFVANIALHSFRPARDALIQVTMTHVYARRERDGRHLDAPGLRNGIGAAFADPTVARVFHERLVVDRPHVSYRSLPHRYATIITVDRTTFRLRLFKFLRLVKSYGVAVGRVGLATPPGLYHVQERQVNPSWHVPNAPWAGSLAGQTIPPGPNDPLVARWLGLGNGIGIHGTNEPFSIGSAASHGCIRMLPADVIALYPRVPLGTPVYIK
jgi:lipoprotein-anchoring transpeptidase ErfK/SrfK